MVEIDRDVAAFWRSVLESGDTMRDWIFQFEPTLKRLHELEQAPTSTVAEHGFRTLVGASAIKCWRPAPNRSAC